MTDIDFDELDKAVNSALKPRADAEPTPVLSDAPVASDTPVVDATPVETEVVVEPAKPSIVKPAERQSLASPALKRSGRFMDMVHPSSDMAGEKKLQPTAKLKIVPTENAPKPEEISSSTAAVEAVESIEQNSSAVAPVPTDTTDTPSEVPTEPHYPDPLDIVAEAEKEKQEPEMTVAESAPTTAPIATEPAGETPFIADAKVEKRPLGGFQTDSPVSPDLTTPSDETLPKTPDESQLPPETALPAALQSDVVAVESDMVSEEAVPEFNPTDLEQPDSKKDEPQPVDKVAEVETTPAAAAVAQSIPQQYHSSPEVSDETPRPVFDTDEYHQPLIAAHSAKKSRAWVFVLLIVALLAVGGALGYFAFMSGL